jgi:hypothetical protein
MNPIDSDLTNSLTLEALMDQAMIPNDPVKPAVAIDAPDPGPKVEVAKAAAQTPTPSKPAQQVKPQQGQQPQLKRSIEPPTKAVEAVIEPKTAETPPPPVVEVIKPVELPAPQAEAAAPDLVLPIEVSAKILGLILRVQAVNPLLMVGILGILEYIRIMMPGIPMTDVAGARNQVRLYNAFKSLLTTPNNNFNLVWGTVLAIVEEYSESVFHWNYALRFLEHITISQPEAKAFETIVSLVTQTSHPDDRSTMAKGHLDTPKPMQRLIAAVGEEAVQKLRSFYRIA